MKKKFIVQAAVLTFGLIFLPGSVSAAVNSVDEAEIQISADMKKGLEETTIEYMTVLSEDSQLASKKAKKIATSLKEALDNAAVSNNKVMTGYGCNISYVPGTNIVSVTYKIGNSYTQDVTKLSSKKDAYKKAVKALRNKDYKSSFYSEDNKYAEMFVLALSQHPEYNYGLTVWQRENGACGYTLAEGVSKSGVKRKWKEVNSEVTRIASQIIYPGMTQEEKCRAIHDYIISNTVYEEYPSNDISDDVYTAYGCLVKHNAVCQGYCAAFNLLAKKAGIKSIAVCGVAGGGNHAWTGVKDGSSYLFIDTTWDDPLPDRGTSGPVSTKYFYITRSTLELDHFWDSSNYSSKYLEY